MLERKIDLLSYFLLFLLLVILARLLICWSSLRNKLISYCIVHISIVIVSNIVFVSNTSHSSQGDFTWRLISWLSGLYLKLYYMHWLILVLCAVLTCFHFLLHFSALSCNFSTFSLATWIIKELFYCAILRLGVRKGQKEECWGAGIKIN